MDLQPGSAVTANLRLVRLLGRGAMGSVWVADHLTLNTQVAVKFMGASVADDPVSVQRFSREAKAAAQIKSPHVVQVFDHGITDDGTPFIVMELLEGESLDKRCRRLGPLNLVELTQIVTQVCKALAKAHEIGIVHRDVKPANIFLIDSGGEPFVKVLDFGVAKFSGEQGLEMTSPGHMVGTPSYMSPEQYFDAKSVSYRSDLWSVGVVAYFALTGQRPFMGSTLGELCVSIKRSEFVPPTQIRGDIAPQVDAWAAKALSREAGARFASAREMAEELERAVGIPSVMASTTQLVASGAYQAATISGASLSRSGTVEPPGGGRNRTALIAVLVVVGALAGVAAGGVLLVDLGPGQPSSAATSNGEDTVAAAPVTPSETPADDLHEPEASEAPEAGAGGSPAAELEAERPSAPDSSEPGAAAKPSPGNGTALPGKASPGKEDERSKRAGDELGI